jgi:glycosyltransferase involved in cell wall biosynthesis
MSFRHEIKAKPDETLIGLVARLDPIKGHEYALQAIKHLSSLNYPFKLVVLGYENERTFSWLHEQAKNLGINDRLISFGLRKDIAKVICNLDIGLITSVGSEANSRAALEFMASGKPVVGTSVGVIPELITDKEQGFIVSPRNPTAVSNALTKLIQNPILRKSLGKNARERVEKNFSLEKFGKVMTAVYEKQLSQKKV